jgi:hypothetical protein
LFEGLIYQFIYNLSRHRLFKLPLCHWLILLCLALPAAIWLQIGMVSRFAAIPISLGAATVLVGIWWAQRQNFVHFVEHTRQSLAQHGLAEHEAASRPSHQEVFDAPLPPMRKVTLYATGFFEVSGMRRYWVETPAQYTTFETREHCVMARISRTRLLLLAQSSQEEVGWWYTFFQPGMIKAIHSGCLHFGLHPRRALRLQIILPDEEGDEVLYLSFEDEASLSLVLADLQYDADLNQDSYPPPNP